jgi:5'(3')-deoxyribonucleotidase
MLTLIDCDGVLADTMSSLMRELRVGRTAADITNYDFLDQFEDWYGEPARAKAEKIFDDPEFWRFVDVMPGAKEAVEALRKAGHEIVCVTTPWATCKNWDSARRTWLAEHFAIGYADVCCWGRKELVDGDTLIDDRPGAVLAFERRAQRRRRPRYASWLYDAPYNQEVEFKRRVSWDPGRADIPGAGAIIEAGHHSSGAAG